ncbi:hypothetical protein CONPUDRAFT_33057, partial [Coniophora puteana RWD-64-598 SS2]
MPVTVRQENREIACSALLDSGATGLFIDWDWGKKQGFKFTKKEHPITVFNVD